MFWQALLAFLAMPALVAFAIPAGWLWLHQEWQLAHPWGLPVCLTGVVGLLWCVRDFYVLGKGTLAPWAPPQKLVVRGLYRFSRNPMYVSVVLVLLGWAISFGARALFGYALIVATAFHFRVVWGEEPWLASTHGEQWAAYARRVPRWFGRTRASRRG
ncbi:isoprenylcysteine carboxylmethyltransferase family protein [Variovorax sp. OV329]|uniref:methyltransferase family protein n=1 Tax=Variovorax sp. OV329 TaxID=1882825 RepID=UPI0008DFAB3F|nr:methyltransferase [Variovorax sp. OV329]SFM52762.1 Protein-S-isoprenylcysteine O-methyltransferase Ste14 [Variovorax sp. OV329]